jgi:hypothetical protein
MKPMPSPSREAERLVALFAKKEKRERLTFLASKRWSDFCDALLHDTRNLDPTKMTRIATTDRAAIVVQLRAKADSQAFCVSAIPEIDAQELPLAKALEACVGRERDTIVFVTATERAYYENHEGERFVLSP